MKRKNAKERILKAAFELFSEKPYDEVTVDEVAKQAGVSKGGLFHYFPSKYELAKESLFYGLERWMREISPKVLSMKSPEEKFRALIEYSVEFILENPKFSRFFLEVYEKSIEKGELEQWITSSLEYLRLFEGVFRELGVSNPKIRALLFGALLDGLAFDYLLMGDEGKKYFDIEDIKREIFEIFTGKS